MNRIKQIDFSIVIAINNKINNAIKPVKFIIIIILMT